MTIEKDVNRNEINIILTSPSLELNGVNVFSANLIQGLGQAGLSAHLLLTEPYREEPIPLPLSSDIPIQYLAVDKFSSLKSRCRALMGHLEKHAPCVYIPNYDWAHSCISPKLSNRVGIVGIVHADDPRHYEHVIRLGKYWNAIVAVSHSVKEKMVDLNREWSDRVVNIPIGVCIPDVWKERVIDTNLPLKVIYAGKIKQHQKRIFDLPKIMDSVQSRRIPMQLTIVGDGPEKQQLFSMCKPFIEEGIVHFTGLLPHHETTALLEQNDVILMTSEFEGLPNVLLEAMGRGCTPLVTDIKSGIPEVVRDDFNGYLVAVGDIQTFATRLAVLQHDAVKRREMSFNAYTTIQDSQYRVQNMVGSYLKLFNRVMRESESGLYRRPRGKILPHPTESWKSNVPRPVKIAYHYAKLCKAKLVTS